VQIDEVKVHPEFVRRKLRGLCVALKLDVDELGMMLPESKRDAVAQDECTILLNAMNAAIATYAAAIQARQSAQLAEQAAELLAYITFMAWYEKCGQPQA